MYLNEVQIGPVQNFLHKGLMFGKHHINYARVVSVYYGLRARFRQGPTGLAEDRIPGLGVIFLVTRMVVQWCGRSEKQIGRMRLRQTQTDVVKRPQLPTPCSQPRNQTEMVPVLCARHGEPLLEKVLKKRNAQ